jgi:hypothetical protein
MMRLREVAVNLYTLKTVSPDSPAAGMLLQPVVQRAAQQALLSPWNELISVYKALRFKITRD